MTKKILWLLPFLALACGFSRSAFVVLPTEQLPSPTAEPSEIVPQMTHTHARTHVCTVTAGNLHLRAGAGVSAEVIAYLHAGDVLNILPGPGAGNWIRIQAGDLTGWVNSKFCKETP